MRTEKFGPYEFVIVDAHIRLNQRRTLRDYFNMLVNLGITLLAGVVLYFLFTQMLPRADAVLTYLIFGFLIVSMSALIYNSLNRISKFLFVPLRDLVHIDKKKDTLNFRMALTKGDLFPLNKLFCLEYGYAASSNNPLFSSREFSLPSPSVVLVYVRTQKKKRYPILIIREPNFQYWSNPGLLDITKPLVERLGALLDIPAKFHREIEIDRYENKES